MPKEEIYIVQLSILGRECTLYTEAHELRPEGPFLYFYADEAYMIKTLPKKGNAQPKRTVKKIVAMEAWATNGHRSAIAMPRWWVERDNLVGKEF